jgi:cystathionine beta-lyase
LERIAELCIRHNVYVVSDEIHSDLISKPHRHIHIASLSPEMAARTVTLFAPSKSFNLAGLATSVAVLPDREVGLRFRREIDRMHVGLGNSFGMVALEAAYRSGDEWIDQLTDYIAANMQFARRFFAENMPEVKTYNGGGTYFLWLDCSAWGMDCEELRKFLVFKAGLGLNPGKDFGIEGQRHARMNLAAPRATVEKALRQLLAARIGLGM